MYTNVQYNNTLINEYYERRKRGRMREGSLSCYATYDNAHSVKIAEEKEVCRQKINKTEKWVFALHIITGTRKLT